ncbi:tyrosine-type recombinase/integrase [Pirellula sp. SH-Sr6A]|uniref:tyrosine-type recombinase/integrase n=1 Tax=Pirellula sp. SH-Sr6A TaxID=1632865 RepID=UPI00143A2ECB|nr:tyrosine-type recombinase/integrase [Pirellula sp. SH-Sr6A]
MTAWTPEEIVAVMRASKELSGSLHFGVAAGPFFYALIWVAYDTGLRPSDLFRLTWSQFDSYQKSILLVQNKTQKPHITFLREESIQALAAIKDPSRDRIFPLTWGCARRWMEKIFKDAQRYGFKRVRGKNLGTLRKSNATQIYISHGESAAAESLGHTSGTRIVRKHYIDHRALRQYSVPSHPHDIR